MQFNGISLVLCQIDTKYQKCDSCEYALIFMDQKFKEKSNCFEKEIKITKSLLRNKLCNFFPFKFKSPICVLIVYCTIPRAINYIIEKNYLNNNRNFYLNNNQKEKKTHIAASIAQDCMVSLSQSHSHLTVR